MAIHRLNPRTIAALARAKRTCRIADGGNLYLDMQGGTGHWLFRWYRLGKQHFMSIGPASAVTVEDARAAALAAKKDLRAGLDPREAREGRRQAELREAAKQVTFEAYSTTFIEDHRAEWANGQSEKQWRASLQNHAWPVFGKVMIRDVSTPEIVEALRPIWVSKRETASRLRGRVESILAAATVAGLRQGENPARWRGHLDQLLPSRRKNGRKAKSGHYSALPFDQIGEFMVDLRGREGVAARALEFLILCAVRTGDIRGQEGDNEDRPPMRWRDVHLDKALWTIPATKMGDALTVPLSGPALALLRGMQALRFDIVFPSADRPGRPLSHYAMSATIRRMNADRVAKGLPPYTDPKQGGRPASVHGFRSTFRDWVAARTNFPREVAEAALAHTIGSSKVESAYLRDDLFEKRARLMTAWANFLDAKPAAETGGKIVALR
jgi:integrase